MKLKYTNMIVFFNECFCLIITNEIIKYFELNENNIATLRIALFIIIFKFHYI